MIKLDVNNGVYTMDMWICLDQFQLAGTVSGQAAFDKPARQPALCRGETAENGKIEGNEETELNGIEGGDERSDEEETESTAKKNWQRQIGA